MLKNIVNYQKDFADTSKNTIGPLISYLKQYDNSKESRPSGVYFLCINSCPVYIGKAYDLESRIQIHYKESVKLFETAYALPFDGSEEDRAVLERFFIRFYRPAYNKTGFNPLNDKENKTVMSIFQKNQWFKNGAFRTFSEYIKFGKNPIKTGADESGCPIAPIPPGKCDACEDVQQLFPCDEKALCKECFDEIALGIVRDQNIHICGGHADQATDKDPDAFAKNYDH